MNEQMNVLQFGEFTLDLRQRQLRRRGEPLPLSGKTFELLTYLTAHPGQALSKETLMKAVWPGSFVEESNLTQNVFLLRKILGSGPEGPIRTLPGFGYLFFPEVTHAGSVTPQVQSLEATHTRIVLEEETEEHISAWRSPAVLGATAAAIALAVVAASFGWQRWEDHTSGAPVQVVLTDLASNTGDAVLDHTLQDAFRIDLAQSPFVTIISDANARRTLVEMAHKQDETLTAVLAREICERNGSQVTLEARLARSGTHYLFTAQATSCVDGMIVASDHREVSLASELPAAVSRVAEDVRHGLGESRRSVARFSTTLYPVMTPSLEALEDYSQAFRLEQKGEYPEAMGLLKQATALDSNFAVAYLDMASSAADMGDYEAQRGYLRRAYDLRDHATEPQRRFIIAQYDTEITGDLHQSVRDALTWTEMYPSSAAAWNSLGEDYRQLDQPSESAAALGHALAIAPRFSSLYYGLAAEQLASGDAAAARATANLAIQRGYDSDPVHMVLCRIALVTSDRALLQQQLDWAGSHPGAVYTLLTQARILQNERLDKAALALAETDKRLLAQSGRSALVPGFEQQLALDFVALGNAEDARLLAHIDRYDEHSPTTALLLAYFGDTRGALSDLARHLKHAPQSTLWNELYGPLIRSEVYIQQNRPQAALDALQPATELMDRDLEIRLTRARAYLALHRWSDAQGDLRFILDHQYLDPLSYAIPIARSTLSTMNVS